MNRRLFFYGTLMSREGRGHVIQGLAAPVGPATLRGRLYNVGPFPALVDGDGVVHGEVWEARSDWAFQLALQTTDGIEGYREGDPWSMYKRVERPLLEGGGLVWTYLWNGSLERLSLIPGGSWRDRYPATA